MAHTNEVYNNHGDLDNIGARIEHVLHLPRAYLFQIQLPYIKL